MAFGGSSVTVAIGVLFAWRLVWLLGCLCWVCCIGYYFGWVGLDADAALMALLFALVRSLLPALDGCGFVWFGGLRVVCVLVPSVFALISVFVVMLLLLSLSFCFVILYL